MKQRFCSLKETGSSFRFFNRPHPLAARGTAPSELTSVKQLSKLDALAEDRQAGWQ
jgi:hypothetical protein